MQAPAPSPVGHRFQDLQTTSFAELSASLLKIIAIAAFVFGVILGSEHWLFIAAASGILSITLYAYSQSGTDESWSDWISRIIFSVKRTPPSPDSPDGTDVNAPPRGSFDTPKRSGPRARRVTARTLSFGTPPSRAGHLLYPVPERGKPPKDGSLSIYVPEAAGPGALEARLLPDVDS